MAMDKVAENTRPLTLGPSPTTRPPIMSQSIALSDSAKPSNYLVLAIFSTLCCCVPTGIVAIVFAAQVDGKWAAGDTGGAFQASDNARLWSIVSIVLGLLGGLVYAGAGFLGA